MYSIGACKLYNEFGVCILGTGLWKVAAHNVSLHTFLDDFLFLFILKSWCTNSLDVAGKVMGMGETQIHSLNHMFIIITLQYGHSFNLRNFE